MEINDQSPDRYPFLPPDSQDFDIPGEPVTPTDYLLIPPDDEPVGDQWPAETAEGGFDQPQHAPDNIDEAGEGNDQRDMHESMHFRILEDNPWTVENLESHLKAMGAPDPHVTTEDVDSFRNCYDQSPQNRAYHGVGHSVDMGQEDLPSDLTGRLRYITPEEAKATAAFAGLLHDAAYKHVDVIDDTGRRAWPSSLVQHIGDQATYRRNIEDGAVVYRTYITTPLQTEELSNEQRATQVLGDIIGVSDGTIAHNKGGNEFDSALAAAQYLTRQEIPERVVIAADACIAATVPFRPALHVDEHGVVTDGHMGELAGRVHAALVETGAVPEEDAWGYTNDIMLISVHLANRDVRNFIEPNNFAAVVHGGRGVKMEEVPELRNRVSNIGELARSANLQRSAPLLYGWLGEEEGKPTQVPAENVPHVYIPRDAGGAMMGLDKAYPPLPIYGEAVENTRTNARMANTYFTTHELSINLVRAVAALIDEPYAPVPGIVNAGLWPEQPVTATSELNEEDGAIYAELQYAKGQQKIDEATPARSPIAAVMFGILGSEGTAALSQYLHNVQAEAETHGDLDPLADPVNAKQYVAKVRADIGEDAFGAILYQLERVATYYQDDPYLGNPERARKLAKLMDLPTEPYQAGT
jgi:hypothetical protein